MTVLQDWRAGRVAGGWVEVPEGGDGADGGYYGGGADRGRDARAVIGEGDVKDDDNGKSRTHDKKEIVPQWAREFTLDGLWGDGGGGDGSDGGD